MHPGSYVQTHLFNIGNGDKEPTVIISYIRVNNEKTLRYLKRHKMYPQSKI